MTVGVWFLLFKTDFSYMSEDLVAWMKRVKTVEVILDEQMVPPGFKNLSTY